MPCQGRTTRCSGTAPRRAVTSGRTCGHRRTCATTAAACASRDGAWLVRRAPVYRFYMVTPALATAARRMAGHPVQRGDEDHRGVSVVSLPACCWGFRRLACFRYPMPELFAFAGLCFLLNELPTRSSAATCCRRWPASSFSIAMSLMMLDRVAVPGARRRPPAGAGWVLALAGITHGIVLICTTIAAIVIVLCKCAAICGVLSRSSATAAPHRQRSLVYGLLLVLPPPRSGC